MFQEEDEDGEEFAEVPPCNVCRATSWSRTALGSLVCDVCGTQSQSHTLASQSEVGESQTLRISGRFVSRTRTRKASVSSISDGGSVAQGAGAGAGAAGGVDRSGLPSTPAFVSPIARPGAATPATRRRRRRPRTERGKKRARALRDFTLEGFLGAYQAMLAAQVAALSPAGSGAEAAPGAGAGAAPGAGAGAGGGSSFGSWMHTASTSRSQALPWTATPRHTPASARHSGAAGGAQPAAPSLKPTAGVAGCPPRKLWQVVGGAWLRYLRAWRDDGRPLVRVVNGQLATPVSALYYGRGEGTAAGSAPSGSTTVAGPVAGPTSQTGGHSTGSGSSGAAPAATTSRQAPALVPISMGLSLAILNWALRHLRCGVAACDLVRWAANGSLVYLGAAGAEDVMPPAGGQGDAIMRRFFSPRYVPSSQKVEWLSQVFARDLRLPLTPLHGPGVGARLCSYLSPPAQVLPLFLQLWGLLPPPGPPKVPAPRGDGRQLQQLSARRADCVERVAAVVVIAVRLVRGWKRWSLGLLRAGGTRTVDAALAHAWRRASDTIAQAAGNRLDASLGARPSDALWFPWRESELRCMPRAAVPAFSEFCARTLRASTEAARTTSSARQQHVEDLLELSRMWRHPATGSGEGARTDGATLPRGRPGSGPRNVRVPAHPALMALLDPDLTDSEDDDDDGDDEGESDDDRADESHGSRSDDSDGGSKGWGPRTARGRSGRPRGHHAQGNGKPTTKGKPRSKGKSAFGRPASPSSTESDSGSDRGGSPVAPAAITSTEYTVDGTYEAVPVGAASTTVEAVWDPALKALFDTAAALCDTSPLLVARHVERVETMLLARVPTSSRPPERRKQVQRFAAKMAIPHPLAAAATS